MNPAWPDQPEFDPAHLRPIAFRSAARILRSQVLADEACDRAIHQYTIICMNGQPPACPAAWITAVASRCATAIRRSPWARNSEFDADRDDQAAPTGDESEAAQERRSARDLLFSALRERLTPRQQEALAAAMSNPSHRGAARACGMAPRDFRRQMSAICRRARQLLADQPQFESLRNGLLPTDDGPAR